MKKIYFAIAACAMFAFAACSGNSGTSTEDTATKTEDTAKKVEEAAPVADTTKKADADTAKKAEASEKK